MGDIVHMGNEITRDPSLPVAPDRETAGPGISSSWPLVEGRTRVGITSVEYSRLVSLPGYENVKVGAQAVVDVGEDPGQVLATLREWVHEQLRDKSRLLDLHSEIESLNQRREALLQEIYDLQFQADGMEDLHGDEGIDQEEQARPEEMELPF